MKKLKVLLPIFILLVVCSAATTKKGSSKPVYAFGVSASFTDTVVYYTDIQVLDSVTLEKKSFLPDRNTYSYQLKNYLEYQRGLSDRTCMIYFSENKKKLTKELNKIVNRYKKDKSVSLQLINDGEFKFTKPKQ